MAGKEQIQEYRGVENAYVARITTDDATEFTCETPVYLAGTAEISKTIESSTEKKYYDNVAALQVTSMGAPELTLSVSALSNERLAYITGLHYDEEMDALDYDELEPVDVALMFEYSTTSGDVNKVVFYKGRFTIPESTFKTKTEDAGEGEGVELTYSACATTHKFTKTGKAGIGREYLVPGGDLAQAKVDLSKFYDEVITPDTATLLTSGESEENN